MSVMRHINNAFALANQRQGTVLERWVTLSSIGSKLPESLLMPTINRIGELDVLLRCMEDELTVLQSQAYSGFGPHHLLHLSELWVGSAYEFVRVVSAREIIEKTAEFEQIKWSLSLLRIPLEKHELAGRWRTGVLEVAPVDEPNVSDQPEIYDPADPKRAFIMPSGLSSRGSAMWAPYDHIAGASRWIERRQIADAMLNLWVPASRKVP